MDEKELLEKILGSEAKLQSILDNAPSGVNPYNENGTINYSTVWRLLKAPEYAEWRKDPAVKGMLSELKSDAYMSALKGLVDVGIDLSKLGYSISQLRAGRQAQEESAPQFPEPPERSQALRGSLIDAARQANMGLSPEQSALAREEDLRNYTSNVASAVSRSGGQSGILGQNLQGLARLRDLQAMRRRAQSAQERNIGANRMASLAAQQAAENRAIAQHNVDRFKSLDLPMHQDRMRQAAQLELAGRQNMWGAIDSLGSKVMKGITAQQSAGGGFWPVSNGTPATQAQAGGQSGLQLGSLVPQYGMGARPVFGSFVPGLYGQAGAGEGLDNILEVDRYLTENGMPSYPTKLKYR